MSTYCLVSVCKCVASLLQNLIMLSDWFVLPQMAVLGWCSLVNTIVDKLMQTFTWPVFYIALNLKN